MGIRLDSADWTPRTLRVGARPVSAPFGVAREMAGHRLSGGTIADFMHGVFSPTVLADR